MLFYDIESHIHIVKIKIDIVRSVKSLCYSRYMGDIYNRPRKDEFDEGFHALYYYQGNVKLETPLQQIKTEQKI